MGMGTVALSSCLGGGLTGADAKDPLDGQVGMIALLKDEIGGYCQEVLC